MLDAYFRLSFMLIMAMSVAALVVFVPLLLIQHFIYKKTLDPIYFNSEHYSPYELSIFTSFPLFFIKTIGYIKAIILPNTMRRKFKSNILKPQEKPLIYLLALFTMLIIIFFGLVIINTGIVGVFIYLEK